jgi:hypothetical protein
MSAIKSSGYSNDLMVGLNAILISTSALLPPGESALNGALHAANYNAIGITFAGLKTRHKLQAAQLAHPCGATFYAFTKSRHAFPLMPAGSSDRKFYFQSSNFPIG